eukprot:TRINITY_DN54326_c0_g1_i1.p1 TRINITY_DN54326_c0_g1~~TRINITY_DN54326_c0_g1_i1.p1  ORF type:complete len:295 (-),score=53.76 TRINITY_DN54326_c0_g1_i1:367-1251(-)
MAVLSQASFCILIMPILSEIVTVLGSTPEKIEIKTPPLGSIPKKMEIKSPPSFEDFSSKEGKALLKDFRKAILSKSAKIEIKDAIKKLGKTDDALRAKDRRAIRVRELGPILDRLTLVARKKLSSKANFWELFTAAERLTQKESNKDMEIAINDISQIVLDEPGLTYVGRVKELSEVSAEFLAMDSDSKSDALATASKLSSKLGSRSKASEALDASNYAAIMKGFIDHGDKYFEMLGSELSQRLRVEPKEGDPESEDWLKASRKLNVLRDFLNDREVNRLLGRIDADRNDYDEL